MNRNSNQASMVGNLLKLFLFIFCLEYGGCNSGRDVKNVKTRVENVSITRNRAEASEGK